MKSLPVVVLWGLNILTLSLYNIYNTWGDPILLLTFVGVILTGVVPMLGMNKTFWVRVLHIGSGVVAAAGHGLTLGQAYKCGVDQGAKEKYILWIAALINIMSGVVAHLLFIDKKQLDKMYQSDNCKGGFEERKNSCETKWVYIMFRRKIWYIIIGGVSFLSLVLYVVLIGNTFSACDGKTYLIIVSPLIHFFAYFIVLQCYNNNNVINFTVNHVAAVASMAGLAFSDLFVLDWFIVIQVYGYLALAHYNDR